MISRVLRRIGPWADVVSIGCGIAVGVLSWTMRQPASIPSAPINDAHSSAIVAGAVHAPILAATRAGNRLIAVGEHGVVLLSDDDGAHWRQAQAVPTQALLTSLSFVDAQQGWAAGHDGVILHTADGGEHWALQREDRNSDKPLLAIRFAGSAQGLAVGLFGLALRTEDGGATWTPFELIAGSSDDKHLYAIFGDDKTLCIAAETGAIYRSTDDGASWSLVQTANIGSFWAGAALADGTLVVAGQRGHVFASRDHGANWTEVASGTQQSLTAVVQQADTSLRISGLAGITLQSRDAARSFSGTARPDRLPLTALAPKADGSMRLFGSAGPVEE